MSQNCCPVSGSNPKPKFDDIGKDARDLLTSNYHFGLFKLSSKTKAGDNIEFTLNGTHNLEENSLNGSVGTKWTNGGVTLTEKWSTNNLLTTSVAYNFKKCPGLKGEVCTDLTTTKGLGTSKVQLSYQKSSFLGDIVLCCPETFIPMLCSKSSCCSGQSDCQTGDKKSGCPPSITATTVFSKNSVQLGCQAVVSPCEEKVLKCASFIVSYKKPNYEITGNINDKSQFCGSLFHKVNEKVSVAAKFGWNSCTKSSCLVGGFNYKLPNNVVFGAHIDNNYKVGLSYLLPLADGVKLTLSSQINSSKFNQSGHKFGFSLNFEP